MNCIQAHGEMLIAEAAELRGAGSTPLALHLAECARCAAAAAAIAGGTESLGVALGARRRSRRARRVALLAALPIAAALVVAVAIRGSVGNSPSSVDLPASARHISVDVAPGQHATVMKTADPNVTVVWLSPGVGQ